jgi:hypothetical protein
MKTTVVRLLFMAIIFVCMNQNRLFASVKCKIKPNLMLNFHELNCFY